MACPNLANVAAVHGRDTVSRYDLSLISKHFTALRTKMDEARSALGLSTPAYTDATLAGVLVKAVHITELQGRTQ